MDSDTYGRYTVREAAIRLGISEAAVRQRIRRHTLVVERSDGIVYVVLADDTPDATPFETASDTPDSTAITTATRQLEAIRDEWLAPLVAQITDQAETIGRLTAERDALQGRVSLLEEQQAAPGASVAFGDSGPLQDIRRGIPATPRGATPAQLRAAALDQEYRDSMRRSGQLFIILGVFMGLAALLLALFALGSSVWQGTQDGLTNALDWFTWDAMGRLAILATVISVPLTIGLALWEYLRTRSRGTEPDELP